jgi:hypothetical protein
MSWSRFLQDQWWVDKHGTVHDIATMDPDHRKNVINFCRRRADVIALGEYFRLSISLAQYEYGRGTIPDGVFWAFETMLAELEDGPTWMENTPLMRALVTADTYWEASLSRWQRIWRWFGRHPYVIPPSPSVYAGIPARAQPLIEITS